MNKPLQGWWNLVRIEIEMKGLKELQRKLREFPEEIERVRREILVKYGRKVEKEAKDACPEEKLKETIRVVFHPNGNFDVKYSKEAKPFVEPVLRRNSEEMRKEIRRRIGEAWRTQTLTELHHK